jgi:hypothetical protein
MFALTSLTAPSLSGPGTFAWSSVTGAASYEFYLYDNSANQQLEYINVGSSTTWTPSPSLTSGHSYTWYAAAVSDNGTFFWSVAETFTA